MIERILSTVTTTSTTLAAASVIVVRRALRLAFGQFHGLAKAWRNRRDVMRLAELDDAALKDIGLTRADVCGALLLPRHRDATSLLVVRSTERRATAREAARHEISRAAPRPTGAAVADGGDGEAAGQGIEEACC
jgi:uncharacterized protein YjiS (DUF1127 family)